MPEGEILSRERARRNRFHRDPAKSYTMPARYYWAPEIFEREKDAIFARAWNFVGHVERVREPGDYMTARIVDQGVFVIRGKDGILRGFHNVCAHRAHELLKGEGRARVITCPYHAWSYHADGRLRTARGCEKVADFDRNEFGLKPVQVEVLANFVFVNLDLAAPSLASQAPELEAEMRRYEPDLDRLTFAHRLTFEIKANWKNVVDNFLECYHCTPAHPAFVDLVDIRNYRSVTYGIHSSHIAPPGRPDNKAYSFEGAGAEREQAFAAWWIWPNVTFNTFPGSGNMTVLHIMPTGPETTLEHFDMYFMDKTPQPCEWAAIEYVDKVLQPEDIAIVESVQRGLHSRAYDQGRFIVDRERTEISEHAVHHFHGLVLDALG